MTSLLNSFAKNIENTNTYNALPYAIKMHEGQQRKGSDKKPYIVHPIRIAEHALALGFSDDELIAAALLHDVCEDCTDENGEHIKPSDLPVNDNVKEIVRLLTKVDGYIEKEYYDAISKNRTAVIVKVLDRCNNVSEMTTSFTVEKIHEYIDETYEYVMPLLEIMERDNDEACVNAAFTLRYHMESVMKSISDIYGF